jgi:hypothetical protein
MKPVQIVATWLVLAIIAAIPSSGVLADLVIISGDEWQVSDVAFTLNPAGTTAFATNVLNAITGKKILIYTGLGPVYEGQNFQGLLSSSGRNVTIDHSSPFSDLLIAPYDAVFLAGAGGSGVSNAPILANYVRNGRAVYLSLGTADFGGASNEAAAWNPFLNQFGLSQGGSWFDGTPIVNIPILPGSHPLRNGVDLLTWGYGVEISKLAPENANAEIALIGSFGGTVGDRGVVGVATPEPSTFALLGAGALSLLAYAWRRRKRASS